MSITVGQIRGARGILNWTQGDLADRTGISATSIGSIEKGHSTPRENTLKTIRKAFEDGGIEFLGMDGVRRKQGQIKIYRGKEGFSDFLDEVYTTIVSKPGTVYVSNVDERRFVELHGEDNAKAHLQRMKAVDGFNSKILISEGDNFFPAESYAEYRWVPKQFFSSVPFYVFGKKLAMIIFGNQLEIIVMDYPAISEAYRIQFDAMWSVSRKPEDIDE